MLAHLKQSGFDINLSGLCSYVVNWRVLLLVTFVGTYQLMMLLSWAGGQSTMQHSGTALLVVQ